MIDFLKGRDDSFVLVVALVLECHGKDDGEDEMIRLRPKAAL